MSGHNTTVPASDRGAAGTGPSADVLVVGGGVIGLAVAWRAAQRGQRVVVADPAPGSGASHAAAGMLTPVAEAAYAERELFALGSESLARYPAFTAELTRLTGLPTGFRQTGTLQVAYDSDDLAVLAEAHQLQQSFGRAATRLTARECREAEPLLDPSVRGGLLAADDGSVDPRLLVRALLAAARQAGVRLIRQPVAQISVAAVPGRGDRVTGVQLADGSEVRAPQVVLAAGWQTARLAGLPAGTLPPVRPVKGQILRLRHPAGMPPVLTRTVRAIVKGTDVYLVPRADGELVVGATQDERADREVTAGAVHDLLHDAMSVLPAISELTFAEATAGLRPGSADNGPVVGWAGDRPGSPGLIVAAGHFRNGIMLSAATADAVTCLLAGERPAAEWLPFTPARFA